MLVQCVADVGETRELLALAAGEPSVAGVVGWLNLDSSGFADEPPALRAAEGGDPAGRAGAATSGSRSASALSSAARKA